MSTAVSTGVAQVPTAHGSRYLQQLCKHWSHNLDVEFTPERGTVRFPRDARGADWPGDALVTFVAKPRRWKCGSTPAARPISRRSRVSSRAISTASRSARRR